MSRPTHIYIISAARPRIGKTLLARALTEFYRVDGRPVFAFDINPEDSALAQFLPKFTTVADIASIKGQMALFDQLIVGDEKPKVIDLAAASFIPFFTLMNEINFLGEARNRAIELVVLFFANPDDRSISTYGEFTQRHRTLSFVPVFADGAPASLRGSFPSQGRLALSLQMPPLSPALRNVVDKPPFSFAVFKRGLAPELPEALGSELNAWIKRVFLQFREMELRILLTKLSSSIGP